MLDMFRSSTDPKEYSWLYAFPAVLAAGGFIFAGELSSLPSDASLLWESISQFEINIDKFLAIEFPKLVRNLSTSISN